MDYETASQAATRFSIENLADVLACVLTDPTLSRGRKKSLAWSVKKVAEISQTDLIFIPAQPDVINDLIEDASQEAVGLTKAGERNFRSCLRAALEIAGINITPGKKRCKPTGAWVDLLDRLPPVIKYRMSRLPRWADARGFVPTDIDDAIKELFTTDICTAALIKNPQFCVTLALNNWNKAVGLLPEMGLKRVTVSNRRRGYALPWAMFAPEFPQDVEDYLQYSCEDDLLGDRPFKAIALSSAAAARERIQRVATALVLNGREATTIHKIADLFVDIQKLQIAFRWLKKRGVGDRYLHSIAVSLLTAARRWVVVSQKTDEALLKICRKLDTEPKVMTEKNKDRLDPLMDPERLTKLLLLPKQLVAKAELSRHPSYDDALAVQTALQMAIETVIPIRLDNLAKLKYPANFPRSQPGPEGILHLYIPKNQVKNGIEIDAELAPRIEKLLDLYIRKYRPILTKDRESPWLFPGKVPGQPKTNGQVRNQISGTIFRETGLKINPHLFRHLAAMLHLRVHPNGYATVQLLLGHKSIATTIKYYCFLKTDPAFRRYDETVTGIVAKACIEELQSFKLKVS